MKNKTLLQGKQILMKQYIGNWHNAHKCHFGTFHKINDVQKYINRETNIPFTKCKFHLGSNVYLQNKFTSYLDTLYKNLRSFELCFLKNYKKNMV